MTSQDPVFLFPSHNFFPLLKQRRLNNAQLFCVLWALSVLKLCNPVSAGLEPSLCVFALFLLSISSGVLAHALKIQKKKQRW